MLWKSNSVCGRAWLEQLLRKWLEKSLLRNWHSGGNVTDSKELATWRSEPTRPQRKAGWEKNLDQEWRGWSWWLRGTRPQRKARSREFKAGQEQQMCFDVLRRSLWQAKEKALWWSRQETAVELNSAVEMLGTCHIRDIVWGRAIRKADE